MTPRPAIRVLLVEDNPDDAELILHELRRASLEPEWRRVQTEADYLAHLDESLDIVLADYALPGFSGPRALNLLRARGYDVPFIIISGSIGEELAVDALKGGASDYLIKDRLARLGQAVRRAIEERRVQRQRRRAETALADAEERMRFALEASRVGVWEVDLRTGVAQWSATLEAIHGLAPGAFRGTFDAFIEQIHPDDRAQVAEALERANRAGTDSNITYRTVWPDGSIHWLNAIGHTKYAEDGTAVRAAGVGIDVTERRRLEDQYRHSQKMEAIGQLAGGVAHDFNNLLTAMLVNCQLLIDDLPADAPQMEELSEIKRAAERATSLTRQLLAFSRRQILSPRTLDLRASIAAIEPMLSRLIGDNIEVIVRAAPGAGSVRADPGQIEQVILNLAINARDAMPDGGKLVLEIAPVVVDEHYERNHVDVRPGRYVMLAVSDTGTGMDAATVSRIFEPFFTTKEPGRGTGLGLATVYGIVTQSGGSIHVYSEPGKGTTFKVLLPRVDAVPDGQAAADTNPRSLHGTERVLVVDDETSIGALVERILTRLGYHVSKVETPRQALQLAHDAAEPFDLLLTDFSLPQMTGQALAERVRAISPTTRAMFMSGYTDHAIVQQQGMQDDCTPFLHKPFSPEALGAKVREALDAPLPAAPLES